MRKPVSISRGRPRPSAGRPAAVFRALCRVGCVLLVATPARADFPPAAAPEEAVARLREMARPLETPADLDPLLERAAKARLVLLGESTHGTSEFYAWRATISRRLIAEHGFRFLVVEGDWAACFRLNRYVRGLDPGPARAILESFRRWPVWMWANEEVLELVEWMREFNLGRPARDQAGFYGMDLYGAAQSGREVVRILLETDEALARRVESAYAGLAGRGWDMQEYSRALAAGAPSSERAVRDVCAWLAAAVPARGDSNCELFPLEMNAKVVRNAEAHFRAMTTPGPRSWNVRADHFFRVVERLLEAYGAGSQGVVWAHNSHIGDARATPMSRIGQRNLGQMLRQRFGPGPVLAVGFGAHRGEVLAGREWGGPRERMPMPPARAGSLEDAMLGTGLPQALFLVDRDREPGPLAAALGHRAIGVVYHPEREGEGQYVPTVFPERYDAFLFFERTTAVRPVGEEAETRRPRGRGER